MCAQLVHWRHIQCAEMIGEGVAIEFVQRHLNDPLIFIDASCAYQLDWPFVGVAFTQSQFDLTGNPLVVELNHEQGNGRNNLTTHFLHSQRGKIGRIDDLRARLKWIEFQHGAHRLDKRESCHNRCAKIAFTCHTQYKLDGNFANQGMAWNSVDYWLTSCQITDFFSNLLVQCTPVLRLIIESIKRFYL